MKLEDTLKERGGKYGTLPDNSEISQAIKAIMHASPNWSKLPAYHKEALDMNASKISRWLVGDFMYSDNPRDIAGYMMLVVEELEGAPPQPKERDSQCDGSCHQWALTQEGKCICPCHKERDPLFDKAIEMLKARGKPTVTPRFLKENFGISYDRASAIIDQLEEAGIISAREAGKPRRVL